MKKIVSLILMLSIICTFTLTTFAYDVNTSPKNYDLYGSIGCEMQYSNNKVTGYKFYTNTWTSKNDDYWSEKKVDKLSVVMKVYVDGILYKTYSGSEDDTSMMTATAATFLTKKGQYRVVATHSAKYDPLFGKADDSSVTSEFECGIQ